MIARRYILKGRVQGVGFRYFTYEQAQKLDIRGWVKNLRSGDVEIRAEGTEEAMQKFSQQIKSGPSFAVVQDFESSEIPVENFKSFSIER